jgi:hypothetical protein
MSLYAPCILLFVAFRFMELLESSFLCSILIFLVFVIFFFRFSPFSHFTFVFLFFSFYSCFLNFLILFLFSPLLSHD